LGHWWLSTLLAALPIVVLLGLLAGLKVRPHLCAIAGAATAVLVAMIVFQMPALLAVSDMRSYAGIARAVRGPIDGSGVEELFNELRNAGAEAIATADIPAADIPAMIGDNPTDPVIVDGVGAPEHRLRAARAEDRPPRFTGS